MGTKIIREGSLVTLKLDCGTQELAEQVYEKIRQQARTGLVVLPFRGEEEMDHNDPQRGFTWPAQ